MIKMVRVVLSLLLLLGAGGCSHAGFFNTPPPGVRIIPRSGDTPATDVLTVADPLVLARDLLDHGRLVAAAAQLEQATARRPKGDPEVAFLQGRLALDRGDVKAGAKWLRACLAREPDRAEAHHALGVALDGEGKAEEAREALQRAWALDPGRADFTHDLGVAWLLAGEPEKALPLLRRCLIQRPGDQRAVNNLAVCLGLAGRREEAFALLRASQTEAAASNNMGVICRLTGARSEALDHFREALTLDPGLTAAAVNLERTLSEQEIPSSRRSSDEHDTPSAFTTRQSAGEINTAQPTGDSK